MNEDTRVLCIELLTEQRYDVEEKSQTWEAADRDLAFARIDKALADLRGEQGDAMEPVPDGVYGDANAPGGTGWRVVDGMVGCAPMDANRMYCGKLPDGWKLMRPVTRGEDGT